MHCLLLNIADSPENAQLEGTISSPDFLPQSTLPIIHNADLFAGPFRQVSLTVALVASDHA
jgi:hypothetical protein